MRHSLDDIITADAETFWSAQYSLSLQNYNTSSYIRDPQFKEHCWAIKIGRKKTRGYTAADGVKVLQDIDWSKKALLAHNTAFDGLILAEHHGIVPHYYYDTVSMTRGLHNEVSRAKLDTIAQFYQIGAKSKTYLAPTKGLRELPANIYKGLVEGCILDTDLCYEVFRKQVEIYPEDELDLIDMTIRMFCDPVLQIDEELAKQALADEMIARLSEILKCKKMIKGRIVEESDLMSNPKFAGLLEACNVVPPTKISNKTGLENFAFAQTDPEFIELLEHEDKRVVLLTKGRLAAKSTQAETRAYRLLQAGKDGAALPVGYNYFGAKTGRWSGTNKLNLQNLPRVNPKEPKPSDGLRRSIIAPPGHVLVVTDSAQIEARLNAWFCRQTDVVQLFREKQDVYKHMAAQVYTKVADDVTKDERFIGKICLAAGTLIYSNRGWIEIERLSPTDKLWDGDNWVCHSGLVMNGYKETLSLYGLWLTPDHLVWSGTKWKEAQYLAQDASGLSLALASAAENSPLQAISEGSALVSARSLYDVIAVQPSIQSGRPTLRTSKARAAMCAQNKLQQRNDTGDMQKHYQMMHTEPVYLTALQQPSHDAIASQANITSTMENVESMSLPHGETTARRFLPMCKHLTVGMTRHLRWIGSTIIKDTSRATSGSLPVPSTLATNDISPTLRRKCNVYDVLSVGPKNRFLALTNEGPLLVHNCVLGLGYSMGHKKFQTTLAIGVMGPPVDITLAESQRIVKLYRARNSKINSMWSYLNDVLIQMAAGKSGVIKGAVELEYDPMTIWLPNGMGLHYPGLHMGEGGQLKYKANGIWKKIYGGLLLENIIQALARIVVGEQMLQTQTMLNTYRLKKAEHARVVLMTHDEIVSCVPERHADKTLAKQLAIMRVPCHNWGDDIPLDADGGWAKNYSK